MRRIIIVTLIVCSLLDGWAQKNSFCIAKDSKTASIIVDADDWKGVIRAARNLSDDVRKVTGVSAQLDLQSPHSYNHLILQVCYHMNVKTSRVQSLLEPSAKAESLTT